MNVLYVSNYVDENYVSYNFDKINSKLLRSTQKFNKLFISGLKKNSDVSNITILTSLKDNRKIKCKEKNVRSASVSFWCIPFLNINIVKQVCLFIMSLLFLLYWCIKNFNKNSVLILDGQIPIVSTVSCMLCKLFGIPIVTFYTDSTKYFTRFLNNDKSTLKKIIDYIMNIGYKIKMKCNIMFILLIEETKTGFIIEYNNVMLKNNNKLNDKVDNVQRIEINKKNNDIQTKKIVDFLKPNVNKSKIKRMNFYLFPIFLGTILIIYGYILKNIEICKFSLILCFISILIKSLYDFKNNLLLILFLISFFTFGMGQYFFNNVTNDILYYRNYPETYVVKTIFMQFLCLLSLNFGYEIIRFLNSKRKTITLRNKETNSVILFKKFILIFLILSFFCSVIINVEKIIFVFNNDYRSLYSDAFESNFPFIISKLASYYLIFFLFYLSLENLKKNICISLILFIINNIINFMSGSRFMFVYGLIFILFYFLIYCFNNNIVFSKKFKKISIYVCLLFVPFLLVFLNMYNGIRNGYFKETVNPLYEIEAFFVSQGRSANLITYAQIYEKELKSDNANFVFGIYYDTLVEKKNIIFNIDTKKDNVENNLGTVISEKVLGEKSVKEGNGLGTNYLAELYINYGFIGIILFNILFGMILGYFYLNNNKGFIYKFYCLSLVSPVLHILRGGTFEAISFFFSLTVVSILLFYFLINIIFMKERFKK